MIINDRPMSKDEAAQIALLTTRIAELEQMLVLEMRRTEAAEAKLAAATQPDKVGYQNPAPHAAPPNGPTPFTEHTLMSNAAFDTPAQPDKVLVPRDSEILDWLERHVVEVREPLLHGSRPMFFAQDVAEEGEEYKSDLRQAVRQAMIAAAGEG